MGDFPWNQGRLNQIYWQQQLQWQHGLLGGAIPRPPAQGTKGTE